MNHYLNFGVAVLVILVFCIAIFNPVARYKDKPKQVRVMTLLVTFNDGWSLSSTIYNIHQAQVLLNRYNWAGIADAIVAVNGSVEYQVTEEGILEYRPCE